MHCRIIQGSYAGSQLQVTSLQYTNCCSRCTHPVWHFSGFLSNCILRGSSFTWCTQICLSNTFYKTSKVFFFSVQFKGYWGLPYSSESSPSMLRSPSSSSSLLRLIPVWKPDAGQKERKIVNICLKNNIVQNDNQLFHSWLAAPLQ